jgi:hypothetical protein
VACYKRYLKAVSDHIEKAEKENDPALEWVTRERAEFLKICKDRLLDELKDRCRPIIQREGHGAPHPHITD